MNVHRYIRSIAQSLTDAQRVYAVNQILYELSSKRALSRIRRLVKEPAWDAVVEANARPPAPTDGEGA
jgi:hypothetical protein